ncbi:hypothetical protein SPI_04534 [Niveomyces insectorum RCEF 264]|uniref:Uncharacterized protein n=1 Tax=Niveomyces insectorum RCEF 264 TaxID=1081102 RepID=A0A167UKU5_9HYPO|nr:hypothetical protein SPI_04534 [Niveomyces insectorum RCEF 264]
MLVFNVQFPFISLRFLGTLSAHASASSGAGLRGQAALTDSAPVSFHDRYDRYDPTLTPHPSHDQRQQRSSALRQRPLTPQREHPGAAARLPEPDPRSTPTSQRSLRRTLRFVASPTPSDARSQPHPTTPPRRVHLAAVSPGISPRLVPATAGPSEPPATPERRTQGRRYHLRRERSQDTNGVSEDDEEQESRRSSFVANHPSRPVSPLEPSAATATAAVTGRDRAAIHPAVRISKRTHNAILFAIEQLTHPNKLSPDEEEESASMADLLAEGGGGGAASNGNGMPTSRPSIPAPAPTNSPRSNIRGPRMIMQERQEREARRAERERMERAQAEQDARVLAEQQRQAAERDRVAAAAAAATAATGTASGPTGAALAPGLASISTGNQPQPVDLAAQRRQQRAERTAASSAANQPAPSQSMQHQPPPTQQAPLLPSQQQQQQQHQHQHQPSQQRPVRLPQQGAAQAVPPPTMNLPPPSAAQAPPSSQPQGGSIPAPPGGAQGPAGASARTGAQAQPQPVPGQPGDTTGGGGGGGTGNFPRNSFPHAFERWEALSAHWEGLTSFWIRQLQQRSEEIDRDPLSRQLARQVTDLSAAGANLFHAVVELQRLRASSERKFQRWFFEMRSDMERNKEIHAMLEAALQEERRGRTEAVREAVENERSNSKIQKQLAEMRKELAISKEEARRAWEELGRREQEERDRVISLQEGLPTIVGGVQVVPMTQGLPSRTRASSTAGREPPQPQQQQQHQQQPQQPQSPQPPPQQPLPKQPPPQHPSAQQPPSQQQQYQHEAQYAPQPGPGEGGGPSSTGGGGSGGYFQQQPTGHGGDAGGAGRAPERYEVPEEELQYGTPTSLSAPGSTYPPSASQQHYYTTPAQAQAQPPADYAGQGYAAPGWETIPRHHHPTRLSDVIEEDERSRTSASQISRGGGSSFFACRIPLITFCNRRRNLSSH